MSPVQSSPSNSRTTRTTRVLAGWTLISLRPVGQHGGLRSAARAQGARVLALSPLRLRARADAFARRALREALRAALVIVTSPAAVRAAAALRPLRAGRGQRWFAVGEGSRRALARAGIRDAVAPQQRMDSEGLLALPALADVRGRRVGLITAPGGRGLLARTLRARGASLTLAEVYRREPARIPARQTAALRTLRGRLALAITSGEALDAALAQLPHDAAGRLRAALTICASKRLAALARARGFADVRVADGARPAALLRGLSAVSGDR